MMIVQSYRKRGVFIVEAATALVLIGLVLGSVAMATLAYKRAHERFTAQRRMQLASEGMLEKYRAGVPMPIGEEYVHCPGGVSLHIEVSPGQGDWLGLTRVDIAARARLRNRKEATYRTGAYFPAGTFTDNRTVGGGGSQ